MELQRWRSQFPSPEVLALLRHLMLHLLWENVLSSSTFCVLAKCKHVLSSCSQLTPQKILFFCCHLEVYVDIFAMIFDQCFHMILDRSSATNITKTLILPRQQYNNDVAQILTRLNACFLECAALFDTIERCIIFAFSSANRCHSALALVRGQQ